ncbi:MAG: LysM peptidoglycan-binding domain-containing protein [Patescibacteria group bacterium]
MAAVLVIAAGYLVYRNFTKVEQEISRKEADLSTSISPKAEEVSDFRKPAETGDTGVVAGAETVNIFGTGGESNVWQPRQIPANSISGNSYTVVSGDTLWEIAVGRYGTGFQWSKILEANKGTVGFLANGQQALIVPGQVLNLP